MMKGKWKRALALGLASAMTLALASCGKGDGGGNANSMLAKQYVYSYEEIDFGVSENADVNVQSMEYRDDRVYVLANIYDYSGAGIMPMPMPMVRSTAETAGDVEALNEVDEEAAADSENSDTEAGEDVAVEEPASTGPTNVTRVISFKLDGSDVQSVDLAAETETEGSSSWINQVVFGQGGSIYATRERYIEDYSDPENPISESRQELVCWGSDGVIQWVKDLSELQESEQGYFYVSNMMSAEDGSLHLMVNGDTTRLVSFDAQGNQTNEKPLDTNAFQNIANMYMKADGSVVLTSYNEDWSKMFVSTMDMATGAVGEKKELPGNIGNYSMYPGTTTDFVLTNNSGVYTYNIGDADVTQIMSFVNSDLSTNYLQNIVMIDDTHFAAAYSDPVKYKSRVGIFTKVNPEDIPDKTVLVLGAMYLDGDVRQRVVDFNKTNQKYRITVKDYNTYSTMDDYLAGYTQLNNDIITGGMPDILLTDSNMPVSNYIAKGLIADVGELIAADEELSEVEFMQNVFDAYSVNGKLYYVVPGFSVQTVVGKKAHLQDMSGWTMEEFQNFMAQMPEDMAAFGELTRMDFMNLVLRYCGTDFVDPSTGKCSFDTQEFINVLEFAKTLPEEINQDYENFDWTAYELQYRNDKTLLMQTSIYRPKDLTYQIKGRIGEPVTFVGFPNASRNGSVLDAGLSFVISSKATDMAGAWEFVRYYLTDEYQDSENVRGMPVKKDSFLKVAQQATEKPFYIDENGEKVETDEYYYLNDEEIILEPFTQEEVDEIVSFIETVNRTAYYNQDVLNIINEETASFFAGQKQAADAAAIIQNRVQLFMDESR